MGPFPAREGLLRPFCQGARPGNKIVYTRKFFKANQVWKIVQGERAPFSCMLLLFTCANGQCFIPSVVIHQRCYFTSDLLLYLPDYWLVLSTPSGYIYWDGWLQPCRMFVKLSGACPTKIQALFFNRYNVHWDATALDYLSNNNVRDFFFKSNDSENDQPKMIMVLIHWWNQSIMSEKLNGTRSMYVQTTHHLIWMRYLLKYWRDNNDGCTCDCIWFFGNKAVSIKTSWHQWLYVAGIHCFATGLGKKLLNCLLQLILCMCAQIWR